MELGLITIAVFLGCIGIGLLYQTLLIHTALFDRIRLQEERPDPALLKKHLPLSFLNIAIICVITPIALYFAQDYFSLQSPTVALFIVQFALFIFLDDLGFYVWHRTLHENRTLLRKVHSIHHRVKTPFPLEFIYVHPVEWMVGTTGLVVAAICIILMYGQVNAYVYWAYIAYRTLHELDIHSNTKTLLLKFIPFYGRVHHHDLHHLRARGNYASTFTCWDKIFKTELKSS